MYCCTAVWLRAPNVCTAVMQYCFLDAGHRSLGSHNGDFLTSRCPTGVSRGDARETPNPPCGNRAGTWPRGLHVHASRGIQPLPCTGIILCWCMSHYHSLAKSTAVPRMDPPNSLIRWPLIWMGSPRVSAAQQPWLCSCELGIGVPGAVLQWNYIVSPM